ncbi:MAG: polysaccharide deacetylase family protein [Alphaproteobacteria bacterium]
MPLFLQGFRPLRAKLTRRLRPPPRLRGEPWDALRNELNQWQQAGQIANFWWRDDDATEPNEPVRRLLALRRKIGVPLALSVIPATATDDLRNVVREQRVPRKLSVLQHGFRHRNYAKSRGRQAELGTERPIATTAEELAAGKSILENWPGWQPVLVPPFNRIALGLIGRLAALGYTGLSSTGTRRDTPQAPGIVQVHAHMDVIAWDAETPRFVGTDNSINDAITHLRAKRLGRADPGEATCLMTHCWAHDDETWDFCAKFLSRTNGHAAARWISTQSAFAKST